MKKFILCTFLLALTACSKSVDSSAKMQNESASIDKETIFSFSADSLPLGCDNSSEIICTINTAVKCIINPEFADCAAAQKYLPSFVFIRDESLQRPTFQSYQIYNLTPRNDGTIEVHTKSSCDGNWFGLCNGNIIYVMQYIDSHWLISDMYAIEF
ncbi:MAG: hypothetical protein IJ184_06470 [Alphaproteobacteria bacterium]|nr:hypothetical protein [Alphaproteobacteria bacterium]